MKSLCIRIDQWNALVCLVALVLGICLALRWWNIGAWNQVPLRVEPIRDADARLHPVSDSAVLPRLEDLFALGSAQGDAVYEKTRLDLKLEGLIFSPEGSSYALVANKGISRLLKAGDRFQGQDAIVRDIQADRIVIENAGVMEWLMLDPEQPASADSKQVPGSAVSLVVPRPQKADSTPVARTPTQRPVVGAAGNARSLPARPAGFGPRSALVLDHSLPKSIQKEASTPR